MAHFDVLIVGAGHAGAQLAIMLRQRKFGGTIGLVSDEPEFPYERPPLSKDYLSGEKEFERIMIRPAAFWQERDIDLLLNSRVVEVNPEDKQVGLADGSRLDYGSLVWAAGGNPRRLSCTGHDLAGIHYIRNRKDVDALISELPETHKVVVIGGGYIGLEAAAVLSKLHKQVTVVEALDRVLARVAGPQLSEFYQEEHRAHGVDIRLATRVECIEGRDGSVRGVRTAEDEILEADLVIAGIGIIPCVEPLIAAGAEGGNGVFVDDLCRTSISDVFAIGDCAEHHNRFAAGARIKLESVQNANDQATTVAKLLTGSEEPYDVVPWFWSNQYDLKLQTVGLSLGYDTVVVRGDPASRAFTLVYLKDRRVIALDCVNMVRDYAQGRVLVSGSVEVDLDQLRDPAIALKSLAAA